MARQRSERPVVIVTGASGGIGEATARLFASKDWAVVLAARSEEKIRRISGEIEESGGLALAVETDVTRPQDVQDLISTTTKHFGRIDAAVNNAGRGYLGTVASLDSEELEDVFRLNVFAPVAVIKAVAPVMRRQGGGVVVNVSSLAQTTAVPFLGSYAASKIALSYLSDAARIELAHDGIAVTTVLPGRTDTGFGANAARIGSTDDFVVGDWLVSGTGGAPPEKVAETILDAVYERPRQASVSPGGRIGGRLAGVAPGTVNRMLGWWVNRYVPREGYAPPSPRGDLARLGLAASATLASIAAWRSLSSARSP